MPIGKKDWEEQCWKPKHRTDSRPWLLADVDSPVSKEPIASTMRDGYRLPSLHVRDDSQYKPKRKEMLRKQFLQEIIEQIEREKYPKPEVEDYCTTYDDQFQKSGFTLADTPPENSEMYLKYPLYGSQPITYWSEKVEMYSKQKPSLNGMTIISDRLSPFKRNSNFSTTIYERLDAPEN